MPRNTRFGKVLARLRAEQGFPNAFSFYNARGGRKVFGLSFANYLSLERGRSLPQGPRLRSLAAGLGLSAESAPVRELLLAYLEDLIGSPELLRALAAAPAVDPIPASWQLAESAARQALSQRSVQLTLAQYQALAEDGLAYACHVVLVNTQGWVAVRELAACLGKETRGVERSLRRLKGAGLAQVGKGKARSPLAGKFVVPPVVSPATASIYSRLQDYRNEWARLHGKVAFSRYLLLRAPEGKFAGYLPHLGDVVGLSALYGDVDRTADTALYLVEGRVTRLFSGR